MASGRDPRNWAGPQAGAGTGTDGWAAVAELGVDFVFHIEADGTVAGVSPGIERLVGEPPSSVVGERFDSYIAREDHERALRVFGRVLDGESVREHTFGMQGEDGVRYVEMSADPVREEGEVAGLRGAAREVTDERQRRRALERRSAAMESAIDGMAVLDGDGEYVYLNEAHAELYGYDREELLGESWQTLYGPEERERLAEEVLPEMERTGSWRGEAVGRRRDGSTFQQELSLSPLDGGGLICIVRDVTDRHRRQAIVAVLARVLRHNLRNDMNVVLGEAEAIERRTDGRVAEAAARIRTTARDLLETSEMAREARRTVTADGSAGVAALDEVVARYSRTLDTPDGTDLDVVESDAPLPVPDHGIEFVVGELLGNALEHAGPEPTVTVEVERTADPTPRAVFRVADDGPGLPSMEREVLEKGHETPLRHGQGLGLWLVNWIVTEADGDLSVHDREPHGTVVEARLPLVERAAPEDRDR